MHCHDELSPIRPGHRTAGQQVDWWWWSITAAATLIFCSCQGPLTQRTDPDHRIGYRPSGSRAAASAAPIADHYPSPSADISSQAIAQVADGAATQSEEAQAATWTTMAGPLPCSTADGCSGASLSTCDPAGEHAATDRFQKWVTYQDEHVCDGHDAGIPVTLDRQGDVRGLGPEDTVVHYRTEAGKLRMEASNRVCIYAPRFAAVRKITPLNVADDALPAYVADEPLGPNLAARGVPSLAVLRRQPSADHSQLGVPTPYRDRRLGQEVVGRQPLREFAQVFAPHEDFRVIRTGLLAGSELAQVNTYVDAAITWTDKAAVQVILGSQVLAVTEEAQPVGEIYHLAREGSPELRLIKLASDDEAQPGEEIQFTLRIDNVGTRPAAAVTILDNLTPRLQYVPETAESSCPADFSAVPNDVGSQVLRWELREPLEPGHGCVLRFTAEVR